MAGDTETGVTIFKIVDGLDSGPIALARAGAGAAGRHGRDALATARRAGRAALLVEALDRAEAGALELTEQVEEGVTYADKIDPAERRLDPAPAGGGAGADRARADAARRRLPGAGGRRAAGRQRGSRGAERVARRPASCAAATARLLVGCGEGALELLEVTPPGKRPMAAPEFLRGHALPRVSSLSDVHLGRDPRAALRLRRRAARVRAGRLRRPRVPRRGRPPRARRARARVRDAARLRDGPAQGDARLSGRALVGPLGRAARPARARGAADRPLPARLSGRRPRSRGRQRERGARQARRRRRPSARQRGAAPRHAGGAGAASSRSATRRPAEAALRHSHPEWIAELWWEMLGPRGGASR